MYVVVKTEDEEIEDKLGGKGYNVWTYQGEGVIVQIEDVAEAHENKDGTTTVNFGGEENINPEDTEILSCSIGED